MILVFIFLGILIFILLLLSLILFSTIKIEIEDLKLANMPVKQKVEYKIKIALYLAGYIKWLGISFDKEKVKKMLAKIPVQKIDLKKVEQDFKIQDLKVLEKLKPKLSKLNLKLSIGLENPIITSFIVAVIASGVSIVLPHIVKQVSHQKYEYTISPIYQNKNLYKIGLNCIIELKMVHIINVIYILIKKGKSDENERTTTSHRKSYGYSYE